MTFKLVYITLACLFILSCNKPQTASDIVNEAILEAGGLAFDNSEIEFTFRNKQYKALRYDGQYKLERLFTDSIGQINDVLTNKGFKRFVNNKEVVLADSVAVNYSEAVNSVHYFSVLPYGLNNASVNKTLLGEVEIRGELYHKIKVTFDKKGGGNHFEDVFLYWFHTKKKTLDYLAYKYHVNGGGMRFRDATTSRRVNGILFLDYDNYRPKSAVVNFETIDSLFEVNELELLSKINLEAINVTIL